MSESISVAVLGGGNGAFITAADLKLKRHKVNLCELSNLNENIRGALERGGSDLISHQLEKQKSECEIV